MSLLFFDCLPTCTCFYKLCIFMPHLNYNKWLNHNKKTSINNPIHYSKCSGNYTSYILKTNDLKHKDCKLMNKSKTTSKKSMICIYEHKKYSKPTSNSQKTTTNWMKNGRHYKLTTPKRVKNMDLCTIISSLRGKEDLEK